MIENMLAFFIIISAGVFFKWKRPGKIDPDTARHAINVLVMNLFLPALCFKVISSAPMDKNTILLPISAIITMGLSLLLSFAVYGAIGKFFEIPKKEKGVLILAASFGNVTFLGLPLLTGLYGEAAANYVLLYDLLATTPVLWIVGVSIASAYGNGRKLTLQESLLTLAKLPPIWFLVIGFIANFAGFKTPVILEKTIDYLAMPIIPLMIFSVGLALSMPKFKQAFTTLPAVLIKLCAAPLIAYGVALLLGMDGLAFKVTIMEAAMPTMVVTLIIASQYKLDHSLSALAIVFTTAVSFIILPIIAFFLK